MELGHGARTPLETWIAIGIALERPLAVGFSRDVADPAPRDAGHLVAQELILRFTAATGRTARFELPTRPDNPSRSVDVGEIDRLNRVLILLEIWNRLDDIGAAARSTGRKVAEAAALTLASEARSASQVVGCSSIPPPIERSRVAIRRSCGRVSAARRPLGFGRSLTAPRRPSNRDLFGSTCGWVD